MRLQAKVELTYAGKDWHPGALFDALERDGRQLIAEDKAVPFNLEDPSTRSVSDIVESMRPEEPPALPDVPPVTLTPTSASPLAAGGTASFNVAITGEGVSGTWTVDKDASAIWLTVTSPTLPQSTDGTVDYTVAENLGVVRVGNIYVNGKSFVVTQAGV
jgi:hypothetical protein